MIVRFDSVYSREGLWNLSLSLHLDRITQLYDPVGDLSRVILAAMAGLDEIYSGEIHFGEQPLKEFLADGPQIRKLGYVFDEGVMLSNLSLKENLLLPLRRLNPKLDEAKNDALIAEWMDRLGLDMDLSRRPVHYRPGQLKLLGFLRTVMIRPKALLIDNPFYLLNKNQRAVLYRVLLQLKSSHPMLIASIDDEFGPSFSQDQIDLSKDQEYFRH